MCIIAYKPWGIPIERQTLEICRYNNPDGAGFMFACEGRLLIKKGFFEFAEFFAAWEKTRKLHGDGLPVVFHFRIATAGVVDKRNCHPHRIATDLGFVHNGILSCIKVPKSGKLSDTILYRDRYLGRMAGYSLYNTKLIKTISRHIGPGNKFVFMNGRGKVAICNEDQGTWKDGIWFSNQSFLPRPAFPFGNSCGIWFCEYCGKILETVDEVAEGACRECLNCCEFESSECCGCHASLRSAANQRAGWCDDCGSEIYGRRWPDMLRGAAKPLLAIGDLDGNISPYRF